MFINDTDYEVMKIEEDFYQILYKGKSIAKGEKNSLIKLLKLLIEGEKRKEEVISVSEKLEIRNPAISLKGTHGEVLIEKEWKKFICSTTFETVYSPDGYEFTKEVREALLGRTKKAEDKLFK